MKLTTGCQRSIPCQNQWLQWVWFLYHYNRLAGLEAYAYLNVSKNNKTKYPVVLFPVLAGIVLILINNLIIIYNRIAYKYNKNYQIEYSLTRLSLFWALAWDPLNPPKISCIQCFSSWVKNKIKCSVSSGIVNAEWCTLTIVQYWYCIISIRYNLISS